MSRIVKGLAALLIVTGVAAGGLVALSTRTQAIPATTIDPADFDDPLPNLYFPLEPGTISRYRGWRTGSGSGNGSS